MSLALKEDINSVSESEREAELNKSSKSSRGDKDVFVGYNYRHPDIETVIDEVEDELGTPDHPTSDEGLDIGSDGSVGATTVGDGIMTPKALSRNSQNTEVGDEATTITSTPDAEAATAILQRIHELTSEANVKTSRHSREIMNRASMDQIVRTINSETDDDDWDIVEDVPEAVAVNGKDTLFARGVVDKYRLAVKKRRESTVRRKSSMKFKRTSGTVTPVARSTTEEALGGGGGGGFRPAGLTSRLRSRMKNGAKPSSTAAHHQATTRHSMDHRQGTSSGPTMRSESIQSVQSAGWSTEESESLRAPNSSGGKLSEENRAEAQEDPRMTKRLSVDV